MAKGNLHTKGKTVTGTLEVRRNLTVGGTITGGGAVVQQANIALLEQTTTDPPTQAEVQAIADKVDAVITALIAAGVLEAEA